MLCLAIACILARGYSGLPFTDTWYVVGHRRENHQNNPAHLVHGEGVTRNESNYLGTYRHLNRTLLIHPVEYPCKNLHKFN